MSIKLQKMRHRIFILGHRFRLFLNENRIQLDNSTESSGDQNKGSQINICGCAMLAPFVHDLNLSSTKIN